MIAKGQVAEQGSHESLAEAGGIYSALVSTPVPACLTRAKALSVHAKSGVLKHLYGRLERWQCLTCSSQFQKSALLTTSGSLHEMHMQVRRQFSKTTSSASLAASGRSSYVNLPSLNTLAPAAGAVPQPKDPL